MAEAVYNRLGLSFMTCGFSNLSSTCILFYASVCRGRQRSGTKIGFFISVRTALSELSMDGTMRQPNSCCTLHSQVSKERIAALQVIYEYTTDTHICSHICMYICTNCRHVPHGS